MAIIVVGNRFHCVEGFQARVRKSIVQTTYQTLIANDIMRVLKIGGIVD